MLVLGNVLEIVLGILSKAYVDVHAVHLRHRGLFQCAKPPQNFHQAGQSKILKVLCCRIPCQTKPSVFARSHQTVPPCCSNAPGSLRDACEKKKHLQYTNQKMVTPATWIEWNRNTIKAMSERLILHSAVQPRTSRISCQKDLKIVMRSSGPSRSMLVATPHYLRALTRLHQILKSDHSPWLRQLGLQQLGWSTTVFCWVTDDDVNLWSRFRWKTKTVDFKEFHLSLADLFNTFVLRLRLLKISISKHLFFTWHDDHTEALHSRRTEVETSRPQLMVRII